MVNALSKFIPIDVSCRDYVHPWTNSCKEATAGLYLYALVDSLRIYGTVYTLALLMRGKIPKKKDVKKTIFGIIQSSAFLSTTSFGYSAFLCSLRRLLGNFNILTVSAVPVFLSSIFAIFIERSSRRPLLCLYVSNVATETIWNMLLARGVVKPIKYGQTMIFTLSTAFLLYYYKTGQHHIFGKTDSIFSALRYIVGPYEEHGYKKPSTDSNIETQFQRSFAKFHFISKLIELYTKFIHKLKDGIQSPVCPHPNSCLYYTISGSAKMFTLGVAVQVVLKLVFNAQTLISRPKDTLKLLVRKDTLSLAAFLGGFNGTFRLTSCLLRWLTGKDAGYQSALCCLMAGSAFTQYSDSSIALYVMWKALQLSYNKGIQAGYLPAVPYFTEVLYCFSTAVLFHAGIVEPENLRPSYWKFLHSLSGGRIACMDRTPIDVWGLDTSASLLIALKRTRTHRNLKLYYGL